MGSLRAGLTVLMLLVVAGVGLAKSPDGPPEYDPVEETNCWDCHKPGAYVPDMDPYVAIIPDTTTHTVGEPFPVDADVLNVWLGPKNGFEMYDFRVTMDISDAPSLRFVSDREPFSPEPQSGEIVIDPTQVLTSQTYLTDEHGGFVVVQVPEGATDVRIRLSPTDNSATTGPDLTLKVYPGVTEPQDDAARTVDDQGAGGAEVFHADSPQAFGELGFGNWTIEAATTLVGTDGSVTLSPGNIGFSVKMDAWFNASAEQQQVVTSADKILPDQRTLVSWMAQAVAEPGTDEVVRFVINNTVHYDHEVQATSDDWQDFTKTLEVPLLAAESGFTVGDPAIASIVVVGNGQGVSIAEISEAIGYLSALLLFASIWTGGMFGKKSRRQLNKVFGSARRRVAFHNFLSYGIIAFALAHFVLFLVEVNYHWLLGVLWGGLGILSMLLLGVTGAVQMPMIRRWNYAFWRWTHFGLAIAAIVFTLVHMMLDGQNFSFVQEALHYTDPLVPAGRQ